MENRPGPVLAVQSADDLIFGRAAHPLVCGRGLTLGGGEVYPELNFTLPTMSIEKESWSTVKEHYGEIATMIKRAAPRLRLPGLVVEFELLPPMTEHPEWGEEITRILADGLRELHDVSGIPCALRVTPTDIRDRIRPPHLRSGADWEALQASFEKCARAGADILSIESIGGKEVHDHGLMYGDINAIIFALGVLAPRDMTFLWTRIVEISDAAGVIPGADSACGFANTAMQLASQKMLPEVLAAVVRAASVPRSLVAYTCGARGPSKDCAYEGPVIKAITGTPISMEGKSASCAHLSPVGNVAAAMCDLWSNESVQNLRLLSGSAPEAFLELLAYDCRLMNAATAAGSARTMRDLLVESDIHLSPQAYVLSPDSTIRIARAILRGSGPYEQTLNAAREAVAILQEASEEKRLTIEERERAWFDRIHRSLDAMPENESEAIGALGEEVRELYSPESYGM
jgi:methanol--5-hydroxybenzimidazolylcobamide Co-methyltransferase